MHNLTTEQTLTKRSQQGDRKAQMELYDRYFHAVYRSALRVVGNAEEAEEVAQESFLKFFSCKGSDVTCVEAVLRRIAINGSIDALRRRKIDFAPLTLDIADNPDESFDTTNYRVEQLLDQIEHLAEPYHTTLKLNVLDGLDYDEIAHYLNISASTVRSHVSRAKKIIAQHHK